MKLPRFENAYNADTLPGSGFEKGPDELADFFFTYGNATYNNGLYRTHSIDSSIKWTGLLEEYYPAFKGKVRCFGYDWEGNMIVQRMDGRQSVIMIFEIATGDYYELEQTIEGFHEEDLVDHKEDTLHVEKFLLVTSHLGLSSISRNDCIAHRVSLLMGGEDVAENMEVTDLEVNWSIQQQLMDEINKMP